MSNDDPSGALRFFESSSQRGWILRIPESVARHFQVSQLCGLSLVAFHIDFVAVKPGWNAHKQWFGLPQFDTSVIVCVWGLHPDRAVKSYPQDILACLTH